MSAMAGISCQSLEAYIDGELSAAECAAFDEHVAACADCQHQIQRHLALRTRLRADLARPTASDAFARRIRSVLLGRDASTGRKYRRSWASVALAASVAAVLASSGTLYLLAPDRDADWQRAVLNSHLRATMSGHVIDVPSSDRHTVKPWFSGKTKVAPIVVDLAAMGYPLLGGRLDIPQTDSLPVLVYKAGPHVVSVFVRAADGEAPGGLTTMEGFSILSWSEGDLAYSAVSDADGAELRAFQRAFAAARQALP